MRHAASFAEQDSRVEMPLFRLVWAGTQFGVVMLAEGEPDTATGMQPPRRRVIACSTGSSSSTSISPSPRPTARPWSTSPLFDLIHRRSWSARRRTLREFRARRIPAHPMSQLALDLDDVPPEPPPGSNAAIRLTPRRRSIAACPFIWCRGRHPSERGRPRSTGQMKKHRCPASVTGECALRRMAASGCSVQHRIASFQRGETTPGPCCGLNDPDALRPPRGGDVKT